MIFGMKVNPVRLATVASTVVPLLLATSAADAITVTRDDNVASLTAALLGGAEGITVTAASLADCRVPSPRSRRAPSRTLSAPTGSGRGLSSPPAM